MKHKGFTVEFNQPWYYRLRLQRALQRAGFDVDLLPHKMAFLVRYRAKTQFKDLKRAIRRVLSSKRTASALVISHKTARGWIVSRNGNRRNQFVRYNG